MKTICIVEDDVRIRRLIKNQVKALGQVVEWASVEDALKYLTRISPDLLILDLNLKSKNDGLQVLSKVAGQSTFKVILTGDDSDETIDLCIDNGADLYFVKDENIAASLKMALESFETKFSHLEDSTLLKTIKTKNQKYKETLKKLSKVISLDEPILLQGETGVGKTYLAKTIHELSGVEGRFVELNCTSIPHNLFESEMFGHKKGAFTGADRDYEGKIKEANGGTLFLDEIDSMPYEMQAKLLKVLEDKRFQKVGSTVDEESDFRLVCAAQKTIKEKIQKRHFREDLYYRIAQFVFEIPALRERKEDIIDILKTLLHGPKRFQLNEEVKNIIINNTWNSNLRGLSSLAKNIKAFASAKVSSEDVLSYINKFESSKISGDDLLGENLIKFYKQYGAKNLLTELKKQMIKYELATNNGKVKSVLESLQIPKATYYKWSKLTQEDHE